MVYVGVLYARNSGDCLLQLVGAFWKSLKTQPVGNVCFWWKAILCLPKVMAW